MLTVPFRRLVKVDAENTGAIGLGSYRSSGFEFDANPEARWTRQIGKKLLEARKR